MSERRRRTDRNHVVVVRLLLMAPFERRPRGWYFGVRRIPDRVVDRLVAAGQACHQGGRVVPAPALQARR